MLYRQAKNKDLQIIILTQLTGLRTYEVKRILEEGGYLKQMTDLVKERILKLYDQGLSDKAIGRELSVSQSQVSPFLRGKGLAPNGRKNSKKNEIKEDKKVPEIKDEVKQEIQPVHPEEIKQMIEEVKAILPQSIPAEITETELELEAIDTLTPGQYFYLAKLTLELLKTMWEG